MGKDLKGKNLGTGLTQRADGRYYARAVVAGQKIELYDTDLQNLKKKFEEEKYKLKNNKQQTIQKSITFKDWFEVWFKTCKSPQLKSEGSRHNYHRRVTNTYVKLFGEKPVNKITFMDIQNATNELVELGISERGIREALSGVKNCLEIAVVEGLIPANPCVQITLKDGNVASKKRRVLSSKEQEIFLKEIETSYYNEAYQLLLLTGMRIGEFSGLRWEDIDFKNKVINISRSLSTSYVKGNKYEILTTPKTENSYRAIPFFEETEELLKAWKTKQDFYKKNLGKRWRCNPEFGDIVFTTTLGSPANRYVIERDLRIISREINLKENIRAAREGREPVVFESIYPHALRHTFCTRCFEKGIDPVVIQRIMGHSDYRVTLSYTHVLESKLNSEIARIGSFLS